MALKKYFEQLPGAHSTQKLVKIHNNEQFDNLTYFYDLNLNTGLNISFLNKPGPM